MFGIFGHGNVAGVGQALEQHSDLMPYLQPKNEQGMVHAAIGYARANAGLATLACSASIGPGATNMLTGAATATVNRVPVLLLPSDTFASRLQGPPMQAVDNPALGDVSVNDAFRPVSVFFDRISRPEQLMAALPAAMAALLEQGRAGAVTLCLHQDVQAEAYDFPESMFEERTWLVARRPPAAEQLAAAVELLGSSQRPLIIAGGGVRISEAHQALRAFAETHGVPVAETSAGKGSLQGSELGLGAIGHSGTRASNRLAREADVVLCVGTRLIDLTTGSNTLFQDPQVRFVSINQDVFDANKLGAAAVQADARLGLESMSRRLAELGWSAPSDWTGRAAQAKRQWTADLEADLAPRDGEGLTQGQALRELNRHAGPSDSLVVASGTPHVDVHKLWDSSAGTKVMMEVGFSTMGHEIPAGLGLRMAQGPEGEVFVVIGDGTYLMGHTELVTGLQEGLKVTVVVFENHGYQSIHALQRGRTGRSFGLEFRQRAGGTLSGDYVKLDLVANARSYGCAAYYAQTTDEVAEALAAAASQPLPAVVVIKTEPHRLLLDSECWWDVGVAEVSTRPETQEAERRWAAGREQMRWFG